MYKKFLPFLLILVFASSFAGQILLFSSKVAPNNIEIANAAAGPLASAYLYADPSNSSEDGSSFAITNSNGQFNMTTGLIPGTYNITAFAIGYIQEKIDLVNVVAGQTTPGINFNLQLSGGISGKVTDAVNGDPINGTFIFAELSNGTGTYGWFGTAGQDGSYLLMTNLVTGIYNVSVFYADGYISGMATSSVVAGVETKNINLQLPRSGIISGKVMAPNGTGLYGISVIASGTSYFGSATTDVSGNFRIATGLGTANYTVYANGAGNYSAYGGILSPTLVHVTAGQETPNINIELTPVTSPPTPSGEIRGRIIDINNNPIRSASVAASGSNGTGYGSTDDNGDYNISSGLLTGNDYNVSVTATGYFDAYYPTLVSVTIGQTTDNINIQMLAEPATTFGTITGSVIGNPIIIPEFSSTIIEIISLALVTAVAIKLKRTQFKPNVHISS
ncbi:MAG: hypothetical protein QG670_1786 [Thermoproteota archaeon]|nr:hypothetical protein [Thermoproteota archaeon]